MWGIKETESSVEEIDWRQAMEGQTEEEGCGGADWGGGLWRGRLGRRAVEGQTEAKGCGGVD